MSRVKTILLSAAAALLPFSALAETTVPAASMTPAQTEQCVTMMAGFPDDSPESRYIFFRLGQELAKDVTPELAALMADYMAQNEATRLPADWPMIDVVEDIADPVLRQAAPAQTVAGMAHIAYFDALCGEFVSGQVNSLMAYDPSLADADIVIREDALYLRQILAESLDRLGAGGSVALDAYTQSLVTERDDIEFIGFTDDVGELEALFMGDLDQKLAKSNDLVNDSIDVEGYANAAQLAQDMSAAARKQAQRERLYSLCRIMPACRTY